MSDPTLSYASPTEAIRVFCGFPNAQLAEAAFFRQLGQTFMPGTPYMLQPMGLAAYLPAVLAEAPAGLPHEFALICYPSRTVWDHAMNQTLRGRVYNQTHGGVYALPPSGAAFPTLIDELPPLAADPMFLFADDVDWQAGITHVVVGGRAHATEPPDAFRMALRAALLDQREALRKAGIDQVVATARDDFAIVWLHGAAEDLGGTAEFLNALLTAPTVLRNERVICVDEPPTVTIIGSQAFNFIFLREPRFFLR